MFAATMPAPVPTSLIWCASFKRMPGAPRHWTTRPSTSIFFRFFAAVLAFGVPLDVDPHAQRKVVDESLLQISDLLFRGALFGSLSLFGVVVTDLAKALERDFAGVGERQHVDVVLEVVAARKLRRSAEGPYCTPVDDALRFRRLEGELRGNRHASRAVCHRDRLRGTLRHAGAEIRDSLEAVHSAPLA